MVVIKQMMIMFMFASILSNAPMPVIEEPTEPVLIKMEATAYYTGTICYENGSKPIPYQTCGSAKKYIGSVFKIYEDIDGVKGEMIGVYYCNDTGSDSRIIDGTVVDLFMTDYETCMEWGRRDVWVEIVK